MPIILSACSVVRKKHWELLTVKILKAQCQALDLGWSPAGSRKDVIINVLLTCKATYKNLSIETLFWICDGLGIYFNGPEEHSTTTKVMNRLLKFCNKGKTPPVKKPSMKKPRQQQQQQKRKERKATAKAIKVFLTANVNMQL